MAADVGPHGETTPLLVDSVATSPGVEKPDKTGGRLAPGQQREPSYSSLLATAAASSPPGAIEVPDVQIREVPAYVKCMSVACLPCTCTKGFYRVKAKTATASLHMGILTTLEEEAGLHWTWPVGLRQIRMSVKERTLTLPEAKVADLSGNPVVVSSVLNYHVVDPKKAMLNVQDVETYVFTNAQAVLKQTVSHYTYDQLKTEYNSVNERLRQQLQPLVVCAGLSITKMSLNDLSYAPEVAAAMLKKQQAQALVEARNVVVEGSTKIAQDAVHLLESGGMLTFTDDQKVEMITSLLTVTCAASGDA